MEFFIELSNGKNIVKKEEQDGYCFSYVGEINNFYSEKESLFAAESASEWIEVIKNLSGFYCVVKRGKGNFFAAVDHVRSIPLFYALVKDKFYLSTSAEWVRKRVGDKCYCEIAKEQFRMLGYVLGSNTLYPSVKQLQAGESLSVVDGKLKIDKYFEFLHIEHTNFKEEVFFEKLSLAGESAIMELIKYANGKQIVVPLSGGYDSRLIVSLLKKFGYENVICFTYGLPNNKEALYSRKVAEALQYTWFFLEYTDYEWREAWYSAEAEEFRKFSANHSSLPHIQDWLAVRQLKLKGVIEDDAIFAPGHCCVTGYIAEAIERDTIGEYYHAHNIIKTHFTGRPLSKSVYRSNECLIGQISFRKISSREEAVREIMLFNWSERQAKYINNSVRVYEYYGYKWWLPLWDLQFVNLWKEVPISLRVERKAYIRYVNSVFESSQVYSLDEVMQNASEQSIFFKKTKNILHMLLPKALYFYFRNTYRSIKYKEHFLGFQNLVSEDDLRRYSSAGYTIIGIYAELYLRDKWGKNG